MYIVTVIFNIPAEHADVFREAVLHQARTSLRAEPDCHQFDVCERPAGDAVSREFFLYEKYKSQAAFDAHLASSHFHEFDGKVSAWVRSKTVDTWQEVCA